MLAVAFAQSSDVPKYSFTETLKALFLWRYNNKHKQCSNHFPDCETLFARQCGIRCPVQSSRGTGGRSGIWVLDVVLRRDVSEPLLFLAQCQSADTFQPEDAFKLHKKWTFNVFQAGTCSLH